MSPQPRASVESRLIAWVAASLAAGPIYAIVAHGVVIVKAGGAMAFLFLLSMAVALWIAVVPIGILIWLVGWLGAHWPQWRHPFVWGVVGAVAGVLIEFGLNRAISGHSPTGAVAGAAVAGIALRLLVWIDPIAPDASAT